MTVVFMAWGKTPEGRYMLTICSRYGIVQSETFLKNHAGKISRQQEEDFKCVMVLELVLDGQNNNTSPVPGTVALTACLIFLKFWQ